ncbi:MAG TPA: hypothetical protein VEC12_05435 [Bacteroidia bacterium]|nr:hypothetical protein [Bacteroidia bacterium]
MSTDANGMKEIAKYLLGKVQSCTTILANHAQRENPNETETLKEIYTELNNEDFVTRLKEIHQQLDFPATEGLKTGQ